MPSDMDVIYQVFAAAMALLMLAVYVAGLIISLFRWNDGVAPRLTAVGFGLLMVGSGFGYLGFQLFAAVSPFDDQFLLLTIVHATTSLINLIAWGLILTGLRRAFLDAARWRAESLHHQ